MSLRTWLSVASVFIVGGVLGYLLSSEEIVSGDEHADTVAMVEDPLIDMPYTSTSRAKDFEDLGLPERLVKKAVDKARRYDEGDEGARLRVRLEETEDLTELADALCGESSQLRPRYGALRFLVEEVQGQRRPVNINRISALQRQDWSKVSPIVSVYNDAELTSDRKPDATAMAIAAILVGKESDLMNGYKPWGRGLTGGWSFDKVVDDNPGVDTLLVEYFVLMHLAVEWANQDGGLCE